MFRTLTLGMTVLAALLSALCIWAQSARAETVCGTGGHYLLGLSTLSVRSGGLERAYVPRGPAPDRPPPLIAFHNTDDPITVYEGDGESAKAPPCRPEPALPALERIMEFFRTHGRGARGDTNRR